MHRLGLNPDLKKNAVKYIGGIWVCPAIEYIWEYIFNFPGCVNGYYVYVGERPFFGGISDII